MLPSYLIRNARIVNEGRITEGDVRIRNGRIDAIGTLTASIQDRVIDARGQLRATLGLNLAGRIDARLPGALPPTPWSRWGDWPALALAALGLILAARRRS